MKRFHSYLKKYDNTHSDKVGVIFGTGPTLNDFSFDLIPENKDDLILFGCNTMCYREDIPLDYYFCGDMKAGSIMPEDWTKGFAQNVAKETFNIDYRDKIKWYIKNILKKDAFCLCASGVYFNKNIDDKSNVSKYSENEKEGFTEKILPIPISPLAKKYLETAQKLGHADIKLAKELGCNCIAATRYKTYEYRPDMSKHFFWSQNMIMPVLQFALYTGVKKLYLVGCDVGGQFKWFHKKGKWPDYLVNGGMFQWGKFKNHFKNRWYPNIQIININPVNLKEFWNKDIYSNENI